MRIESVVGSGLWKLRDRLYWLVCFAVVFVGWFVYSRIYSEGSYFFPTIWQFLDALVNLFARKNFAVEILYSTARVVVAFALSVLLAVPTAFVMHHWKAVDRFLSPMIDFARYVPVPALSALTILFFGIDETAKVALLFLGTYFQIVLLLIDDLNSIPQEYYDLSYSLNFSAWQKNMMKWSAVLPSSYDNMRVSFGLCWTYVIIAEYIAASYGMGHALKEVQRFQITPEIYAILFCFGINGLLWDQLFKGFYYKLFDYQRFAIKKNGTSS